MYMRQEAHLQDQKFQQPNNQFCLASYQKFAINTHASKLVYHHTNLQAMICGQNMINESGLTSAKSASYNSYRCFFHIHFPFGKVYKSSSQQSTDEIFFGLAST